MTTQKPRSATKTTRKTSSPSASEPHFFPTPAPFRAWLKTHHAKAGELLVGYYKVDSGKPSMTWPESVDEALCFGWIDGVRRSLGTDAYTIRFTPRRKSSVWSAINIKKIEVLEGEGRMTAAGRKAFEARQEHKSRIYAFEQGEVTLAPAYEKRIKANKTAWAHFSARTPAYRKKAIWWVMSAKAEETRIRRVEKLIEAHAQEKLL